MRTFTRVAIVLALVVATAVVLVARQRRVATLAADAAKTEQALPRLVDLGSTTCVPCKKMVPILDALKAEYAGALRVEVIDVKADREASAAYGIRVIPTQIFYAADGVELWRHEGFIAEEDILTKWRELGVELRPTGGGE